MEKDDTMEETIHHDEEPIRQKHSLKRQLIPSLFVLCLLIIATIFVVLYGKGYRLGFQQGEPQISKTGILQLQSKPTGAQVSIDGHLATATDNNINLTPGKYKVTISKDGYNDWQKDVQIKREVVSNADVTLFPKAPTLQSISTFGVESASIDPSGTRLALKIASNSAKKNGIYVFDMTSRSFMVLDGQSSSTQLVDETSCILFSQAKISWSPDGKQILAAIQETPDSTSYYLLKADGFNEEPQNVTVALKNITDAWQQQRHDKEVARFKSLKPVVQKYANKNFKILAWSPDETKILYQARNDGTMPVFLTPRLIGNNLLYERRDIQKGAIYVYDRKEDINTRIVEKMDDLCINDSENCTIPFTWFPDSGHLIYVHDKKIDIVEDDGANMTTIYAGPFVDHYVFPWPDASRIVILTNLNNSNTPPTLYTITLQ